MKKLNPFSMEHRLGRSILRARGFEVYKLVDVIGDHAMTVWVYMRINGLTYEDRNRVRQTELLDKGYVRVYD